MKRRLRPRSAQEKALRERWAQTAGRLSGHHAIRRQIIERLATEAGLDVLATAWDTRWMMHVSDDEHERHTNRSRRLPLTRVPERAWQAARDLDRALVAAGRPETAVLQLRREYEVG